MANPELYIPSFHELPAEGDTGFRPPLIDGSFHVGNGNVTKADLQPVIFAVRSPKGARKQVVLSRPGNQPLRMFDASPTLPPEYSDMSHVPDATQAELELWSFLAEANGDTDPLNRPDYPRPTRFAIRGAIGELALEQCDDEQFWTPTSNVRILNPHAAQAFLDLAGAFAAKKLAA